MRALASIPHLSIHLGTFLSNVKRQPLAYPPPAGPRTIEVLNTEEKGSDVNLATYLLCDGYEGDYEVAVVISNDSDLALPVQMVRDRLHKPIGILNPSKNPSWELRQAATFTKPIRQGALAASQFPPTLTDPHGTITRPATW